MIKIGLPSLMLASLALVTFGTAIEPLGNSTRPKPGQRSLGIVFDTTGSMGEELETLRREIKVLLEFAATLPTNPFYNYIFVDFNDPGKCEHKTQI
jgi:hypothetical protein